jgi:hypothetical protein
MDTVVLVTLARESADDAATRELVGDGYDSVMNMLQTQDATAWRVASRYLSGEQLNELRDAINQWRQNHPDQRYVSHVRLVDFLVDRPTDSSVVTRPSSIFSVLFLDPLAGIDPAVRESAESRDIAERMFVYAQRAPLILSWRVVAQYRKMLAAREVAKVVNELGEFNENSRRFTAVTDRLADTFAKLPGDTENTIEQLASALTTATDTTIRQATTQAATEREAALNHLGAMIRAEEQEMVRNVEAALVRSTDRLTQAFLRVSLLIVLAIFGLVVGHRLLQRLIPPTRETQSRDAP